MYNTIQKNENLAIFFLRWRNKIWRISCKRVLGREGEGGLGKCKMYLHARSFFAPAHYARDLFVRLRDDKNDLFPHPLQEGMDNACARRETYVRILPNFRRFPQLHFKKVLTPTLKNR